MMQCPEGPAECGCNSSLTVPFQEGAAGLTRARTAAGQAGEQTMLQPVNYNCMVWRHNLPGLA